MNKRFRFTTSAIAALPANPLDAAGTELEFSDTEIVGLRILSGKTGSKRFLLRYNFNGRKCSIAIGRFPDVDVATARKIARQYKQQIAQGIDPREEKAKMRAMPTVSEFFYQFYLPQAKKRKKTWQRDEQRFVDHCRSIQGLRYDELTVNHVMKLQMTMASHKEGEIGYQPATVNRVIAVLKTMGKLAAKLLDIPNVAEKVSLLPENNIRTRYCDVHETQRIINAALHYPYKSHGCFIAMLFLTGCRYSELQYRTWDDVDLTHRILSIPNTKNGTAHLIYLSDLMVKVIEQLPRLPDNPYLFAGSKPGKPIGDCRYAFNAIKFEARIKNPHEVLFHTARHSVASNLMSHGADITSVQRLLNHKSISSTLRYAKLSEQKQRETSQALTDLIVNAN